MNNLPIKKYAIIIDGHSLAYRAYFSTITQLDYYKKNNLPPTNALINMIIMISKLLENKNYTYGLVAFDTSRKSFRTEKFEDYKANRDSMPEEMIYQMPLIIEALKLFGFQIVEKENFEADDLIATFSKICCSNKIYNDIFSSDQDLLQLVDEYTNVNLLKKGVSVIDIFNNNNFKEKYYGLDPKQVIDLKALTGDSSDNYKGVKGIGPKSGVELVKKFGSIKNLLEQIDELPEKIKTKFNDLDQLKLFLEIATIIDNVEIEKNIDYYQIKKIADKEITNFLNQHNLLKYKKYY